MHMTGLGKNDSWIALTAAVALAACGGEPAHEPPLEVATSGPANAVKIQFGATIDPSTGLFEVTHAEAITGNGLAPVVVVQNNVAGSGPANTVELVTTSVGFGMGACGAPSSFCGSVTLRSF